jgi:hypothetical protein
MCITDINELDKILLPKTPAERERLLAWLISKPRSLRDIEAVKAASFWRSPVEEYRGHLFCVACSQLIRHERYCSECGHVVGWFAQLIDFTGCREILKQEIQRR